MEATEEMIDKVEDIKAAYQQLQQENERLHKALDRLRHRAAREGLGVLKISIEELNKIAREARNG